MISMRDPSFAFNSIDVPGPNYTMWITRNGYEGMPVAHLAHLIDSANRSAWENRQSNLLNIVINCHGSDWGGALYTAGLGKGEFVHPDNVYLFSFLRGKGAGTIWLVACRAARGSRGKELCRRLAFVTGYQVVAAEDDQDVGFWPGYRVVVGYYAHEIDDFEGTVYGFTASGSMRVIDPHDDIPTIRE